MWRAADPVALSTGGSWDRQAVLVQLRYVTDHVLRWYENSGARVDVDVSVYPV